MMCRHGSSVGDDLSPPCFLCRIEELEAENAALKAERKGVIEQSNMHPMWLEKSKEELLDALRFQGATTHTLLEASETDKKEIAALKAECKNWLEVADKYETRYFAAQHRIKELREALEYVMQAYEYDGVSDEHGSIMLKAKNYSPPPTTPPSLMRW